MEKKIWTAPEVGVVQFAANEYVAACNTSTDWSASGSTLADSFNFYLETTGDENLNIGSAYHSTNVSMNYDHAGAGIPYDAEYFSYLSDNSRWMFPDYAKISDQMIMDTDYNYVFDGCATAHTEPTSGVLNGWWVDAADTNKYGKARFWWDSVSARIHALFGTSTQSG